MAALHRTGFANLAISRHKNDGLRLTDAYVLSAVRCAPPNNKPLPEEITHCLDHLDAELAQLPGIRVVVALGKIAFDAWLQRLRRHGVVFSPKPRFGHGVVVLPGAHRGQTPNQARALPVYQGQSPWLIGCYHPSRQNTNTGRLTARMMVGVFRQACRLLDR